MYTLGSTTVGKCSKQIDSNLGISCVAHVDLDEFTAVKLRTDGEVEKMSAADQSCFGMTRTGAKAGELVTVDVPFSHIMKAEADATVAIADKLQFTGYNGTAKFNLVKPVTTASKPIHGVALSAGADGDTVVIGVLAGDNW